MNYVILFVVIVLAIVAGQMLTQSWLLARAKRRHKQAKESPPRPKSEPQSIEFNMVLSGVDDVEIGLDRIRAVIEQIAEAANGVPITVNNSYYGQASAALLGGIEFEDEQEPIQN